MNKYIIAIIVLITFSSCQRSPQVSKENNSLAEALGADDSNFQKAYKPIKFNFPQDHGAHNGFKSEWWYFTGNLKSQETNRDFGYQLTIFRNAFYKPQAKSLDSNWAARQVYMGHLGLSDLQNKKFYSYEILEREALGLAGSQTHPFKVWIDNWQITSLSKNSQEIFPLNLKSNYQDLRLDLIVEPSKNLILQGNQGLSQKSQEAGNASYYYSYTRLKTRGTITIQNQIFEVEGYSWMDREWSTSALAQDQSGWDWFAIQLDNNCELMLYQLRNNNGDIDTISSGTWVESNGNKIHLNSQDFKIKVLKYWTSLNHKQYPSKWQIQIAKLGLNLIIEPRMADQEHKFNISYWEGAVKAKGKISTKDIQGLGYVELTGY